MEYAPRITPYHRQCCDCRAEFEPNHNTQIRCIHCSTTGAYARISRAAHIAVRRAVEVGVLPSLKAGKTACVDCSATATDYDHRDYGRPIDVDPVCRACNLKRGPAAYDISEWKSNGKIPKAQANYLRAIRPDAFVPSEQAGVVRDAA